MEKGIYSFVVEKLYYINIERPILSHYDLGFQNSSTLPSQLSENDSGEYLISGTKKSLSFYLDIKKTDDQKYIITCYPS